MKKLILSAIVFGAASVASATSTLNLNIGGIYGVTQGVDAPVHSIGVVVASGSDSLFPDSSQIYGKNITQYAPWGGDDVVIAIFAAITTTIDGSPATRFIGNSQTIDYNFATMAAAGINPGDKLALYWFPTITDTNTASPNFQGPASQYIITAGLIYGFYRSDIVANQTSSNVSIHANNNAFVAPPDAYTGFRIWALNAEGLTATQEADSVNYNPTSADFTATVGLVPEPSTYAVILGLFALSIAYRRRK